MEVQLKSHTKLKVSEVGVGKTFRLINQMKVYQVIDLSQIKILPSAEVGAENAQAVINDPHSVFAVDLSTGIVESFGLMVEVYLCPVRAIEKDEE